MAALLKCFRYAGEFNVAWLGLDELRVIQRGSLGEAGALLAVALMFAQRHRLRLTFRADTLPPRHANYLGAMALFTLATTMNFASMSVNGSPYVWLMLIAFLIGLSSIAISRLGTVVALIAACGVLASLAGLAPGGSLAQWTSPPGLVASLTLAAPMQALNLALAALLGRGLRQRLWPGAARERRNRLAMLVTSPQMLTTWVMLCLLLWCFGLTIVFGIRHEGEMRRLVPLQPQFAHIIALAAFTAGALHGRRALGWLTAAYLLLGVALPVALALLAAAPGNPVQSAVLEVYTGRMPPGALLRIDATLGHLQFGRGLELPLYALLGAVVAAKADVLQRDAHMSAPRIAAADVAALAADEIEPERHQVLPSLSFVLWDVLAVVVLAASLGWGIWLRFVG